MGMKKQQILIMLRSFKHINHWHQKHLIFFLKFWNAVRRSDIRTWTYDYNKTLDPKAIISIGIAPIELDRHAGQYNSSLGYHSNSGRVYTSWKAHANTLGLQYGEGNTIAIYVTYFGEHCSTVLLYYNNFPIATRYDWWNEMVKKIYWWIFRYHFEENKERYLPTITFSGGHVDVSVLWPEAVERLPSIPDVLNSFLSSEWIWIVF